MVANKSREGGKILNAAGDENFDALTVKPPRETKTENGAWVSDNVLH